MSSLKNYELLHQNLRPSLEIWVAKHYDTAIESYRLLLDMISRSNSPNIS